MQLRIPPSASLILSLLFVIVAAELSLRSPTELFPVHHGVHLKNNLHKRADPLHSHGALRPRAPQASPSPTQVSPTPSATAGAPSLDATKAECQTALGALNGKPQSPTGMSACFRIAFLDTASGEFEADVFLYQVAPASGNWTSVDPKTLHLGLSYPNASIASEDTIGKRERAAARDGVPPPAPVISRREARLAARAAGPVLVTNMSLVGELDDEVLKKGAQDMYVLSALPIEYLVPTMLTSVAETP